MVIHYPTMQSYYITLPFITLSRAIYPRIERYSYIFYPLDRGLSIVIIFSSKPVLIESRKYLFYIDRHYNNKGIKQKIESPQKIIIRLL